MNLAKSKRNKRLRRHRRVRAKIFGTSTRPRLSIFRSNKHIWAQLIDDSRGMTLAAAGDPEIGERSKKVKGRIKKVKSKKALAGGKLSLAEKVGELIAHKAETKKIARVVLDRGGYKYHGIVKAVAEGARKGGLKF